jgi:regulator of protease activity HflC (stomatin/prohibitin superfamily)
MGFRDRDYSDVELPKFNIKPKRAGILAIFAILVVIGLGYGVMGWHSIDVGEAGVVFDKQARVVELEPLTPGWQWVAPITKEVTTYDTRVQKETLTLEAASFDSQIVTTEVTVNYIIAAEDWPYIYKNEAKDLDSLRVNIIDPQIQETLKSSTAKFKGEDLIPQRQKVKEEVSAKLTARLATSNITVTDVSLTNFKFPTEYQDAIERKQVAYQDYLTAVNKKQEEITNAEIMVIQANATAEAMNAKGKALKDNPELVALTIADRWDGIMPHTVYLTEGGSPVSVILNPQASAAKASA